MDPNLGRLRNAAIAAAQRLTHADRQSSMRKILLEITASTVQGDWPAHLPSLGVVRVTSAEEAETLRSGQHAVVWDRDAGVDSDVALKSIPPDGPCAHVAFTPPTAREVAASLCAFEREFLFVASDSRALRGKAFDDWTKNVVRDELGADVERWLSLVELCGPLAVPEAHAGVVGADEIPDLLAALPAEDVAAVNAALELRKVLDGTGSLLAPSSHSEHRLVSVEACGVAGSGPLPVRADFPDTLGTIIASPRWAVDAMEVNLTGETRTARSKSGYATGFTRYTSFTGDAGTRSPCVKSVHAVRGAGSLATSQIVVSKVWARDIQAAERAGGTYKQVYKLNPAGRKVQLPSGEVRTGKTKFDESLESNMLKPPALATFSTPKALREKLMEATGGGALRRRHTEFAQALGRLAEVRAAHQTMLDLIATDVSDGELQQLRELARECEQHASEAKRAETVAAQALDAARDDVREHGEAVPSTALCARDNAIKQAFDALEQLEREPAPGMGVALEYALQLKLELDDRGIDATDLGDAGARLSAAIERHAPARDGGPSRYARGVADAQEHLRAARAAGLAQALEAEQYAETHAAKAAANAASTCSDMTEARRALEGARTMRAHSHAAHGLASRLEADDAQVRAWQTKLGETDTELGVGTNKPTARADTDYREGPLASLIEAMNRFVCAAVASSADDEDKACLHVYAHGDVIVFDIEGQLMDFPQLDARGRTIVALALQAALRKSGVAPYVYNRYAIVCVEEMCGIWEPAHMRRILRALIDVGGYDGVLCCDLPEGVADSEAAITSGAPGDGVTRGPAVRMREA